MFTTRCDAKCSVDQARELRNHIVVYKKGFGVYKGQVYGNTLETIKANIEDLEAHQYVIPPRVWISLALREAVVQAEAGNVSLHVAHEQVRYIAYSASDGKLYTVDRYRPKLIDCELDDALRIVLHREIFMKVYLPLRVKALADASTGSLLNEWKFMDTFLECATSRPITQNSFNEALADFTDGMTSVRYSPSC